MYGNGNPAEGIGGAPGICDCSTDPANTSLGAPFQDVLSAALDYAANGFAVFPCWPRSKDPATPRGFYNATSNPATIRRWWLANPDYNIAIQTGIASGVWVFDIDGAVGATTVAKLEAEHGPLPETLISITSSGCHLWFKYTSPVPCRVGGQGGFPVGIDIRADGGYVMAPPSIHPDGPIYRWANNRSPALAPDWLIDLTRKPKPSISQRAISAMPLRHSGAYGKAALDREISTLASTPNGQRNHALNRASFCLHQLVAGGELNGAEVHRRLIEAATANGLMAEDGPRSVALTIRSGARAGMQHPRNRRRAS